jgi:hypothetical protein
MRDLSSTIETLYDVFAQVKRPESMLTCPCCVNDNEAAHLLGTPLREIGAVQMSPYAELVFLTVGGTNDFRYFLPRILDIAVQDESWWPSPEITLKKLNLADWHAWADREQQAVTDVIDAWYDAALNWRAKSNRADDGTVIYIWDGEALLCGIAHASLSLTPYLDRLRAPEHRDQLAGLFMWHYDDERRALKRPDNFWDEAPEDQREVLYATLSAPAPFPPHRAPARSAPPVRRP